MSGAPGSMTGGSAAVHTRQPDRVGRSSLRLDAQPIGPLVENDPEGGVRRQLEIEDARPAEPRRGEETGERVIPRVWPRPHHGTGR